MCLWRIHCFRIMILQWMKTVLLADKDKSVVIVDHCRMHKLKRETKLYSQARRL